MKRLGAMYSLNKNPSGLRKYQPPDWFNQYLDDISPKRWSQIIKENKRRK